MSVITPEIPVIQLHTVLPVLSQPVESAPEAEWWVAPVKWVALTVFISVPLFCLLAPSLAGRVVWTVVVAALPLFIVLVGYHRWRKICPLAFFAQLPILLRLPGRRRASKRLEAIYYYVAFSVFFFSLWLRLIATNGDGIALAIFFIVLALIAVVAGAVYTGKTWCNYFCPLSFIEKIYTEPHGLRETPNSQCDKCTACKKSCPDISQENGYWKEIESKSKRFVYFAFPGLVFGFYFYYFLQAGTWDYYFGGTWTNQPNLWRSAFLPGFDATTAGFFFFPQTPRALATFLTLSSCALLSFVVFSRLELVITNWKRRSDAKADDVRKRHVTLSLAAFVAFVTFYTFAGAPTLRKLPWGVPHLFLIVVVLTATLFLVRRLRRQQIDFAEETLGRNIIKRWQWGDSEAPRNLREALLIHQIRTREKARGEVQILDIYREAVQEALADGLVTREEVQMLDGLRNQLQLKDADHRKVMLALDEEDRATLSDPLKQPTAEKRLQLGTYSRALGNYFERILSAEGSPDESFIRQLSSEYNVTKEEHEAVLKRLLGDPEGLTARLTQEVARVECAALTIVALQQAASPAHDLLCDLLRRSQARAIERLLRGISHTDNAERLIRRVRESLASEDAVVRASALEELRAHVAPETAEHLVVTQREKSSPFTLTAQLNQLVQSVDPHVRALALFALFEHGAAGADLLRLKRRDESQLVCETAEGLLARMQPKTPGATIGSLLIVEKMIALRAARVFNNLSAESLAALALASSAETFPAGTILCNEGEAGNEVFILLDGDVKVFRRDDTQEKQIGSERAGGLIGEMAILDPAPRSATVVAGDAGVRVLHLDGVAFRQALAQQPSIAAGVIRALAQRLREAEG